MLGEKDAKTHRDSERGKEGVRETETKTKTDTFCDARVSHINECACAVKIDLRRCSISLLTSLLVCQ